MDKKFFVELTNDLYRLTILFPKEEPIRIKIRGLADDILTDLITILQGTSTEKREAAKRVERSIGILESMLEIAETQKWVKEEEFESIMESYSSIRKEIEEFNKLQEQQKVAEKPQKEIQKPEPLQEERKSTGRKVVSLNDRQKKILEILENGAKVQVQDVIDRLDESVTKRTIRRDFQKLMDIDVAERIGKANMTYYRLKE